MKKFGLFVLVVVGSFVLAQEERFEKMFLAPYSAAPILVHPSLKMMLMVVRTPNMYASFIPTVDAVGDLLLENYVQYDLNGAVLSHPVNLALPATWTLDIESGTVGGSWSEADVYFHILDGNNRRLEPIHGAEFALIHLEVAALPMASFHAMANSTSLEVQPTVMMDTQGSDWAAMAPVLLPRNAVIMRIEADVTEDMGYLRAQLMADQYGQSAWIGDVQASGNSGNRILIDNAEMNFNHEPFRETLYLQVDGTGDIRLHSLRISYLMP